MSSMLRRVTIERLPNGTFKLVRERDENGETLLGLTDLVDAFDAVLCIYRPDGSPRTAEEMTARLARKMKTKRSKRG